MTRALSPESSPAGGDVSTPLATLAAGAAPVPLPAPAAASSFDRLVAEFPAFLNRGWLRLTTAEVLARVHAALAERTRRKERTATAHRRAVARACARGLARDRQRKAKATRARRAAGRAERKRAGHG